MKITFQASRLFNSTDGSIDDRMLKAAGNALSKGLQYAVGVIQRAYLSGPRPNRLGVVTGRLRGSMTHRVDYLPDRVVGRIGTNIPYAAYHEFGAHGPVNVRAHTRTVAEFASVKGGVVAVDSRRAIRERGALLRMRTTRDGRSVPVYGQGAIVGYKENRGVSSSRAGTHAVTVNVRAHVRKLNYSGRPFIRTGLADALPRILRSVRAEMHRVMNLGRKNGG